MKQPPPNNLVWLPTAKAKAAEPSISLEERCARLEDLCERLVVQVYDLHRDKEALQSLVHRLLRNIKKEKKNEAGPSS